MIFKNLRILCGDNGPLSPYEQFFSPKILYIDRLVNQGNFLMQIKGTDRRQNAITVDNDRRSGIDRREQNRENPSLFYALETVPTFRRVCSIPDKINNGETAVALGMAGLAAINLKEDMRDVKGAIDQIKGIAPKYDYKNYQHNFSFLRGTIIEKWLHKQIDAGKKWAIWLENKDITLAGTSFGDKVLKIVNAKEEDVIKTSIKNAKNIKAKAIKYEGSFFAKLTGRALRRTTLLGVFVLGVLELPKIFKSTNKGENICEKALYTINQVEKSAINIVSLTAGIGYFGALGAKYAGPAGSLAGMGLGAIMGNKVSAKVQKAIE